MARAKDGKSFANIGTGSTAQFYLNGGLYGIDYVGTGTGTATLQKLGGDGETWVTAATAFSATTGYETAYLSAGWYRVTIATFTANYINIARIQGE
jgi:hypothetical protein